MRCFDFPFCFNIILKQFLQDKQITMMSEEKCKAEETELLSIQDILKGWYLIA